MKRRFVIIAVAGVIVLLVAIFCFFNQKCQPCDLGRIIETLASLRITENDNEADKDTIVFKHKKHICNWLTFNDLGLCESYIRNEWNAPDLENVLYKLLLKGEQIQREIKHRYWRYLLPKYLFSTYIPVNSIQKSKKNVEFHYDIGNDLYTKMLGETMQYTCATGFIEGMTLDEAQLNKMKMIGRKLQLKEGMTVLDIGCGFGTLANYLQQAYKVNITGVTLSENQYNYATTHFKNVKFILQDYRQVTGTFDRVYSIGMFEHVGRKNMQEYFDTCYKLLKLDGIMFIHTIGTKKKRRRGKTFVQKYIFPGGELPHLSHMVRDKWNMEHFENFGHSYAKTVREWYNNVSRDNWGGLPPEKYNERFKRIWKFWLLGCAANFRSTQILLWQIVYRKNPSFNDYSYRC